MHHPWEEVHRPWEEVDRPLPTEERDQSLYQRSSSSSIEDLVAALETELVLVAAGVVAAKALALMGSSRHAGDFFLANGSGSVLLLFQVGLGIKLVGSRSSLSRADRSDVRGLGIKSRSKLDFACRFGRSLLGQEGLLDRTSTWASLGIAKG